MQDGKTIQLIYNPTAGSHCPKRLAALRTAFETGGARIILSESSPLATVTISADASHVCTLGGDGTVRHVALALSRSGLSVPMSVYPGGTVNLLHREISSPVCPNQHAVRVLSANTPRAHYSVAINDSLFLACASVGPDSRAVAAVSTRLKRRIGKFAYVAAFLGILLRWERQPIRLHCNGEEIGCEAFYVAKGRYFAGPWSFARDAQLTKPLLHVIALGQATRLDYARFIWAMLRGKAVEKLPGVRAFTCTQLSAEASAPLPIQADGDIVGSLPARMQVSATPLTFF